jgi:hypothetical protein
MLVDCLVLRLAAAYAQRMGWSPIRKRVLLEVHSSRDTGLRGRTLRGVISATGSNMNGFTAKAIVDLDSPVRYCGHYGRDGIESVRTSPARRWQDLERLLILPIAVHLIDCDVYDDDTQDRVIAFATMRLDQGGRSWRNR